MTTMHLSQRSSILISHSVRLVRVIASTSSNTIQAHYDTQLHTHTHAQTHTGDSGVILSLFVDCARVLSCLLAITSQQCGYALRRCTQHPPKHAAPQI